MQTASAFARAAREIIDGLDVETSSTQSGTHRVDLQHGVTPIVRLTASLEGTEGVDALLVPQLTRAKKVYVFDWDVCIEKDVLVRTEKMEVQAHLFVEMSVNMEEGLFLRAFEMLQQRLRQVNPAGDGVFLYAQIRDKHMRSHIGLYKEAGFACHRHVFPPGVAHPTSRVYDLVRPLVTVEERLLEADMEQIRDEEAAAERAKEEEEEEELKAKRARQKQARRARRERLAEEAKKAERARQARRERQARRQEEEEEEEGTAPSGRKRTASASVDSTTKKHKARRD